MIEDKPAMTIVLLSADMILPRDNRPLAPGMTGEFLLTPVGGYFIIDSKQQT